MEFKKNLDDEYMFPRKERNAEEMLQLYIYSYMKERNLHEVAKKFAEKVNIEMLDVDYDEGLLKDWWVIFWPLFCSRMSKQPGGHSQSSAQPLMEEGLKMLPSLQSPTVGVSQQLPSGNPPEHVNTFVGQPPVSMSQTPQGFSQQRAGKRPVNTDTTSIVGYSAASAKGKWPLSYPQHSSNSCHLQMPATIRPPPQLVSAYRSVKLEPTYPAGQDPAHLPAASIAGETNWQNQGSFRGVRGSGPDSNMTRVPAAFLAMMLREAEEHMRH